MSWILYIAYLNFTPPHPINQIVSLRLGAKSLKKKKMLLFKEHRVAASFILRDVFQTLLGLLQSPSYNDTQGLDWGRQLLVLTVSEDLRSIPLLGLSWEFYWIKLEHGEFAELQKCPNLFLKDWHPFCATWWDRELRGKKYLNKYIILKTQLKRSICR